MITINKNQEYDLTITGMTHDGMGVGKIDNFAVFVEGAITGEVVKIKIIKLNKGYGIGKLIKIIEGSQDRTRPFCSVYKQCGGCSLQHMSYEAQLNYKKSQVEENLRRIGKVENVNIHDTIGMTNNLNYRNKVQYPVGVSKGQFKIGFYERYSHDIVESEHCGIQDPVGEKVRHIFKEFMKDYKISVYDEKSGKGLIRHIMIRKGFKTGEVMVVVVINDKTMAVPLIHQLTKRLTSNISSIRSIFLNINMKKTNVILGEKNINIFGPGKIIDSVGKYKFEISPLSFFQVNPVQTEVLYQKVLEYANLKGEEVVFDLYSGIGTISIYLSEFAKKVYGIEVVKDAVINAKQNAKLNGVSNVQFYEGEVEKIVPELYERGIKADVVIIDPPRKGCEKELLDVIINMQPKKVIYVSCNPATLARDLGYLQGSGFMTKEVQPVDMFPHTTHVETVALLQRI